MAEVDPLVSTEEVEVDTEIAAAIDRGIRDADGGQVTSADRVRELLSEWKETSLHRRSISRSCAR